MIPYLSEKCKEIEQITKNIPDHGGELINTTQKEYTDELQLIERQNNYEFDLYFAIHNLMTERPNIKGKLSVRAVCRRTRSKKGQIFYGLSNFPDFVILDRDFENAENSGGKMENVDQIYGCIEIKALGEPLLDIRAIIEEFEQGNRKPDWKNTAGRGKGQLLGDILWYRKVLYTNGYEWKYYEWNPKEQELNQIISLVKERMKVGSEFNWYEKIDFSVLDLRRIHECEVFHISDVQNGNLKKLTEQIDQIEWKRQPRCQFPPQNI